MNKMLMVLLLLVMNQVYAFPCYFTLAKDNCWLDYTVTVNVLNAKSGKSMTTIIVPEGEPWGRRPFECEAGDTLALEATFSPTFWAGDEDKVFKGMRYWQLPQEIKEGTKGWNITVCFPKYFSNVPLPPKAKSHCVCDTDSIPKVDTSL